VLDESQLLPIFVFLDEEEELGTLGGSERIAHLHEVAVEDTQEFLYLVLGVLQLLDGPAIVSLIPCYAYPRLFEELGMLCKVAHD
jgi:hypothetical protein